MRLVICSLKKMDDNPNEVIRYPVGHLIVDKEVLRVVFFLLPDLEIIVRESEIDEDLERITKYDLMALKQYENNGSNECAQYRVGSIKVTRHGGVYLNLNLVPHVTFQVTDPEHIIMNRIAN